MNIGDKVRVVHGTEEGNIVRILPDGMIEIEIEDGFTIPVLAKDVVVIQPGFQDTKKEVKEETTTGPISEKGIYLAIAMKNQEMIEVFFVNNTDHTLLIAAGKNNKTDYHGLCSEKLKAKSYFKIDQTTFQKISEDKYQFDFIIHDASKHSLPKILSKSTRIKPALLQKATQQAPLINKPMHLVQLDADALKIDPLSLKESLSENKVYEEKHSSHKQPTPHEVDLHIEQLTHDHEFLTGDEMIRMQLHTFEKALDNAIAFGMDEITFIHGVGNGKLRMEIHRILAQHDHIAWFKDAAKQRFGYGATQVKIK